MSLVFEDMQSGGKDARLWFVMQYGLRSPFRLRQGSVLEIRAAYITISGIGGRSADAVFATSECTQYSENGFIELI